MSRGGGTRERSPRRSRTVLAWIVYALGIIAAVVLVASALFAAGGYFGSEDTVVSVSPVAVAVWGGLVALAAATWLWRRRGGRR